MSGEVASPSKRKPKQVPTPIAVGAIALTVAIALGLMLYFSEPRPTQGVMSREASLAAASRYRYAVERWNNEVAAAKREGREPDRTLQPRPTGAMSPYGRPRGFEGFGPGSLETRPRDEVSGPPAERQQMGRRGR